MALSAQAEQGDPQARATMREVEKLSRKGGNGSAAWTSVRSAGVFMAGATQIGKSLVDQTAGRSLRSLTVLLPVLLTPALSLAI